MKDFAVDFSLEAGTTMCTDTTSRDKGSVQGSLAF